MKYPFLLITLFWIGSSCQSKPEATVPTVTAEQAFSLPQNPKITLPNGTKTPFSKLVQPHKNAPYNVLLWASWCPPDSLPQSDVPLVLLSIDQSVCAWKIAIKQLPEHPQAIHGNIDPYAAKEFLTNLGMRGIPQMISIEP